MAPRANSSGPRPSATIRPGRAGDAEMASMVLAEAFTDSPWLRWAVEEAGFRSRVASLQRLTIEQLVLPYGEMWVAVEAEVLERADTEGAIAFLETSTAANVEFYEGLGLTVSGEVQIPDGGPHVWAMTRHGRGA